MTDCLVLSLPICKAIDIEVAAVVDVEEDIADGIGKPEGLSRLLVPVLHQIKTWDHIEECFGGGEQCVEHQGGHKQQADKRVDMRNIGKVALLSGCKPGKKQKK